MESGEVIDLMEIKIVKGCGKSQDFSANGTNEDVFGTYSDSRRCWTSNVHDESFDLTNKGYVLMYYSDSNSKIYGFAKNNQHFWLQICGHSG